MDTQASQPGPTLSAPKKRNWLKILGIAAITLVVFAAGIVALVFSMGAAPMKASEKFLTELSSNRVDQAYESASIQFKQTVTREKFNEFLAAYPVVTKVKTPSFNSFSIENNTLATVSGTVTATDGQVSPITLQLVNENNEWRVLNFDLNPPPASTVSD